MKDSSVAVQVCGSTGELKRLRNVGRALPRKEPIYGVRFAFYLGIQFVSINLEDPALTSAVPNRCPNSQYQKQEVFLKGRTPFWTFPFFFLVCVLGCGLSLDL